MKFLLSIIKIFYLMLCTIILMLFTILVGYFITAFIPCNKTNMDRYLYTDGYISPFAIFPEKNEINGEIIDYHDFYYLVGGHEIYLEVVYSESDYKAEIQRLEKVSYICRDGTKNTIEKDNANLFNFTTYISVYNNIGMFEYACINPEEYRIVYITLKDRSPDIISFDEKYLPKNYDIMYNDRRAVPYYMYIYYNDIYNMPEDT